MDNLAVWLCFHPLINLTFATQPESILWFFCFSFQKWNFRHYQTLPSFTFENSPCLWLLRLFIFVSHLNFLKRKSLFDILFFLWSFSKISKKDKWYWELSLFVRSLASQNNLLMSLPKIFHELEFLIILPKVQLTKITFFPWHDFLRNYTQFIKIIRYFDCERIMSKINR